MYKYIYVEIKNLKISVIYLIILETLEQFLDGKVD